MTPPDESAHRCSHRAAESVTVRDPEEVDGDDDMFEVRLPIASTGEVRNEGDEPLTRAELDGMARQIREREIGVFPSHGGDTMVTGGRYSQLEKLGVWTEADVEERDGADLLMATARMPDPDTLPNLGSYREALGILKEQAKRGIPMDASIGWRDDEDAPGGVDLMEASIVGIGADPRTNTGDESAAVVARAAVDAGADPDALVREVRDAVADTDDTHDSMTDDTSGSDDAGTTETDDEQDADDTETERVSEAEYRERMLDLQTQQMDVLSTLAEREGDKDDEEDEDDEDEQEADDEDDDEDDEDEQAAEDPDETQSADPDDDGDADTDADDLRAELDALREELESVREGGLSGDDVDTPESESERDGAPDNDDADPDEQRDTTDTTADSPTDGLGNYR